MNQKRISALNDYVQYWERALQEVEGIRNRLLQDKQLGFALVDDKGNDVLQDRIKLVEASVIQHQEILIRMQSIRDRAVNGEDV